MESYKHLRKQLLKNKEFRKAYTALGPEFALIQTIIEKRTQKGLTQAELARRMKTKQSAIARLESGNYNPTLEFLEKTAKALDAQLKVSII
ncbi:helix-turn-helix transcriptional regulator [Candidatus Uhrbacteria bacterium]|nr:helix-turn-helix transcriptional regulator [Candidatus Uhrbacteria bacterium]